MYMPHGVQAAQNTKETLDQLPRQPNKAINVSIRLMFTRIGDIDTLNERYQAQASIEARWPVEFEKLSANLSPDDQKCLAAGKSISLVKYNESHWHPQLFIENAIGDLKEQIKYSAKKRKDTNEIYVCEHRDIKGSFWEKLELQHFPADIQDLSISLATMLYDDKVLLMADPHCYSGINREVFVDQQEWLLYEHVNSKQRFVKEFVFQGDGCDYDDDERTGEPGSTEGRKRSVLSVTCHAARHSNYFFWNGYCVIFLITLLSFSVYALPTNLAGNRIQTTCTLLLALITFRWRANRSLPTISYLTSLDIYGILAIFILVLHGLWHSTIGALTFAYTLNTSVDHSSWVTALDHVVFLITVGLFVTIHILLLMWLQLVPLKERKNMEKKDAEYRSLIAEKVKRAKMLSVEKSTEGSSNNTLIPIEKSAQYVRK